MCQKALHINKQIEKLRDGGISDFDNTYIDRCISIEGHREIDLNSIPVFFYILLFIHEDDLFLKHQGFNYREMLNAIKDNILHKSRRGGSSITQQLSKILIRDRRRSYRRKLIEAFYAYLLEKKFSKEEILYSYLFSVNFGLPTSGLRSTAKFINVFDLREISIAQTETIISLLPAPLSRFEKLKSEGIKVYNFSYSFEKLLSLYKILYKYPEISGRYGLRENYELINNCLEDYHLNKLNLPSREAEIDCINQASITINQIPAVLAQITLGEMPKFYAKTFLSHPILALCKLAYQNSLEADVDYYARGLTSKEEMLVAKLALKNDVLAYISIDKARELGLNQLSPLIIAEKDKIRIHNEVAFKTLRSVIDELDRMNIRYFITGDPLFGIFFNDLENGKLQTLNIFLEVGSEKRIQFEQENLFITVVEIPSEEFQTDFENSEKNNLILNGETVTFFSPPRRRVISYHSKVMAPLESKTYRNVLDFIQCAKMVPDEDLGNLSEYDPEQKFNNVIMAKVFDYYFYETALPLSTSNLLISEIAKMPETAELPYRIFAL